MKLEQAIQQHLEKFTLSLQGEVLDYVLYTGTENRETIPHRQRTTEVVGKHIGEGRRHEPLRRGQSDCMGA